ncbi:MAG TPA: ribonuclease P protein component [Beijerinckiaceae bacterium]|nr:ribonuclease P protein component [Beijerinckiaceae bacterium]HVB89757.1 ribonuclease P protein component [Beijerinckiaceae bacterium]
MSDSDRSAGSAPERLKLRRDFVAASRGARFQTRAFSLQGIAAREAERPARFGFTATKKVGNAVERNRIRRRFREAVRLLSDTPAEQGHDYVIFARREALAAPFQSIKEDLRRAIVGVHTALRSPGKARSERRRRDFSAPPSPSFAKQPHDKDQAPRS